MCIKKKNNCHLKCGFFTILYVTELCAAVKSNKWHKGPQNEEQKVSLPPQWLILVWYQVCEGHITRDSKAGMVIFTHQTLCSETWSSRWAQETLPVWWWSTVRQDGGPDAAAAAPNVQSPHHAAAPADTKRQRIYVWVFVLLLFSVVLSPRSLFIWPQDITSHSSSGRIVLSA